ncbi:two-component sensor histidine kinase [Rhizocola hellebori]|uniref:histidine kinase n=1 Tax=Rhizocola hellebori TaxID=1392758 RepID=A0A8J3QIJ7_9ACTN|nr:HAMP domain-containing sensor histidine kinase [Rhizocola hellebori]GIH11538.1 two-component sensor histidine kinase [Rhizocola hellebori]
MKTLRARMVLTVVGLAAVALIVVNVTGVLVLQRYLVDRLDIEVNRLAQVATRAPETPRPSHGFPRGVGDSAIFIRYDSTGAMLPGPSNIDAAEGPTLGPIADVAQDTIFTASNAVSGESFRVKVTATPGGGHAVAAISLTRVDSTVNQMTAISVGVSLLVLLGLGLASYHVVGLGLKPLTRMENDAASIADGDLAIRIADTDPATETGRLGLALNTMLGRIEGEITARVASEQRLRQFLADASHELRTPLTSIRGFAELYRRGGTRPGPELDESMARIEFEAARMGLLVEDLLLLAALDEERPLNRSKVDLLAVAADTVRDAHVRSPHRTVRLADFEPVTVSGDEHRLRQVTTNLVTNALQHTPATASVTLRVRSVENAAVLEVSDTGPGIAPEHAPHIFERLYRADPSRARPQGGAGLGLAIASSIVKAHGGRLELADTPGPGATFRVLLPR